MNKEASEKSFPAIADVLDHLRDNGWKVTKTSLYRHAKEGKLIPGSDGSYRIKDVEKYAKTWLKQQSTGKKVNEKTDELMRRKAELEIDQLEIQKKRSQFAYERDLKLFIRLSEVEIEFAAHAGILAAGLTHWIKSHAAGWIRLVCGDMTKLGEFQTQMLREIDVHINGYATTAEFNVVFDGNGGAEAPEEEEEGAEE
jgi:hypothetical protein